MVERLECGTASPPLAIHRRPLVWSDGVHVFVYADRFADLTG